MLTNILSRAIGRIYIERFGLTIPEWRVMAVLGRFAPSPPTRSASARRWTRSASAAPSRACAKPELVEHAVDGADRRRSALRLSAAGRKIHAAIVPLAQAKEAEFLAGLPESDRHVLDRLITRLTDRARALDQADG